MMYHMIQEGCRMVKGFVTPRTCIVNEIAERRLLIGLDAVHDTSSMFNGRGYMLFSGRDVDESTATQRANIVSCEDPGKCIRAMRATFLMGDMGSQLIFGSKTCSARSSTL